MVYGNLGDLRSFRNSWKMEGPSKSAGGFLTFSYPLCIPSLSLSLSSWPYGYLLIEVNCLRYFFTKVGDLSRGFTAGESPSN